MKRIRTKFWDKELVSCICMWELGSVGGFVAMLFNGSFTSVTHGLLSLLALLGIFGVVGILFHLIGWLGENFTSQRLESDDLDSFLYY